MARHIALIFALAFVTACVSTSTLRLDSDKAPSLKNGSLVVSTTDRPDFSAMTTNSAVFPEIGALPGVRAGNRIVRSYGIEDPAIYIGTRLATRMAEAHEMALAPGTVRGEDDTIENLATNLAGYDYALDTRTITWSFTYFPTDFNNYRVIYSAKVRRIELGSNQTIAEAFCARVPEQTPDSPTYEQLLNRGAERLKMELRAAAEYCAQELSSKLF